VLLTSGASTFLVADPFGQQMNSLPLFVFATVRSGEPLFIQRGFAAAAVLLALVLVLFALARYLRARAGVADPTGDVHDCFGSRAGRPGRCCWSPCSWRW